jgi:hypothetical protein
VRFTRWLEDRGLFHRNCIYKRLYLRAIEAAAPLQTGGRLSHLLLVGDSTVIDGLKALIEEVERLTGEVERRKG